MKPPQKAQPQHPHLKTTPKRRHGRPAPSPSRTPRVGTAALAAHAGPGLHSPAGAGTHREGPCRSRRVTSRIARKLLPRPTHQKAPARGGSRCKGSGERKPPPPGAFSTSRASNVLASYSSNFSETPPKKPFGFPIPKLFGFPIPKHGSVTEKGLLVQVFGLIQTFPIGKTRATNAAVHSLSHFPWSDVSRRTPFPPCQHAPRPRMPV